MQIEMVSVSDINPATYNPRKISEQAFQGLKESIKKFGVPQPLIVNKKTKTLVGGHQRLKACEALGMDKVPVVYVSLNKVDEKALNIALNSQAISGEFDQDVLQSLLKEIKTEFSEFDDILLNELEIDIKVFDPVEGEDSVPEVKHDPVTKRGDIWILGSHRIMCGDSTMIDDVDKLMNGEKADMVFTDPPYGYKYESSHQNKHKMLQNDDKILDFIPVAYEFTSPDATLYLCTSHQVIEKWKPLVKGFNYKNLIVWKKNNWSMGDLKGAFAGQHELIIFASKGNSKIIGKRDPDVWSFNRCAPEMHPTQKTIELIEYAMSKWQSGKVLDMFGGSGSTLIACEKTNRKCFMMELDEHYCDVIINRWQDFTGQKAVHENGTEYNSLIKQSK